MTGSDDWIQFVMLHREVYLVDHTERGKNFRSYDLVVNLLLNENML